MKLLSLKPREELQQYIDSFWVFESDFGVPVTDNRVTTPNGEAKIIISYRNSLFTNIHNSKVEYKEQEIFFIST